MGFLFAFPDLSCALRKNRGRGGNALLYDELVKSVKQSGFKETELVQVSERTEMMIKDLHRLGADFNKTYRMYSLPLSTHTRAPSF